MTRSEPDRDTPPPMLAPASEFTLSAPRWEHWPHCPHCHRRVVSEDPEATLRASGRTVEHSSTFAGVDCPHCGGDLRGSDVTPKPSPTVADLMAEFGDGPDAAEILAAVRDGVELAMPLAGDVLGAVRRGVDGAMPRAELILDTLAPWTPLPAGSSLILDDGNLGAFVVALRGRERGEVMTDRGGVVTLDDDCRLRVGPKR